MGVCGKCLAKGLVVAAFSTFCAGNSVSADETHAREILQSMSDHLAGLREFSVEYDATLEVVTVAGEKLGLARSGRMSVARPDKLRATRTGGFSDLEIVFDGQTLTLFGRHAGAYTSVPAAGNIDALVDALRDDHGRPLPAADLLVSDPFDALMSEVEEIKDLGSGFVEGRECDHLAFRSSEVDWQIWVEVGDAPVPCRFIVTARDITQAPQYTVTFRNWTDVAEGGFDFEAPADARAITLEDYIDEIREFPEIYDLGDQQ